MTVARWRAEFAGALNATAAMLPFVLTFGFIVYGALGAAAAQVGLGASVIAVVVGGAAMALLGRSPLPAASPSASASLILGGAVLALARDAALGGALIVAACALVVVASGLLLMLLGALRAGSLVRFVPQPVLAGFMNGVALLIVVSQMPPLLGLPADVWARDGLRSLAAWQGLPLAVALATALLMALVAWRWPRLPAPLVALVVAGIAVALAAGPELQRIGALDHAVAGPAALRPLAGAWPALAPHAGVLALTALLLALIGALESVLSLAAIDQQLETTSDPDRELVALGAANVFSGLVGGLPLVYLRLRALATLAGGGRTRRSLLLGCALVALVFTLGLPLVERLPTAVVAGIVVMLAWALVDRWSRQLARQWWQGDRSAELRWSLAVVALVCAVTLARGFVAGVAAGVLAAMLIFVRAMNRSLVRARYDAAAFPSRRVWSAADESRLAPLRARIGIVELEGAVFFANAGRLVALADAPPAGELVVDLRRVTTIDASGALAFARLAQRLGGRGVVLRLAGVRAGDGHARALAAHGVALAFDDTGASPFAHADLDRAIEAAERRALGPQRAQSIGLRDCTLFEGLDDAQFAALVPHLRERRLAAGERLFAEGDAGDALYVLTAGSVSVVDAARGQRFASFSPGMCFGETALLDGGGRSADAVADAPSTLFELGRDAFAVQPETEAVLYRNLARHLSARLRAAAAGWRNAAG
jgi:SulP family sulfate permease